MRKKIVAGNWKMNLTYSEGLSLAEEVCKILNEKGIQDLEVLPEVLFFPPYLHLSQVVSICKEQEGVSAGAQNCHTEAKGAYTGEISAPMIKSTGATHVLVGHSERRAYFSEDDQMLAGKVKAALENDLTPVFCCGEKLPEREKEIHFEVVSSQVENALFWLDNNSFNKVVIAYEPVWAIGTGVTASPEQAQEMHAFIRKLIKEKYGEETAENTTILYGGSCNPKNAQSLFSQKDVDGGLIGGASLKAMDFIGIIKSF